MSGFDERRARMVREQVEARGIANEAVLAAMRAVPREAFLPAGVREQAYADRPVSIGKGQTASQPFVVALMASLAAPGPEDTVLEVGAGAGYAAGVLSRMARHVYAIERHGELARHAQATFDTLGYDNITVRTGDGTQGWAEAAPFEAILAAAAGEVPQALRMQLRTGGRLVMPVPGPGAGQDLKVITRTGEDSWEEETAGGVRFVPLVPGPAPED